jgi:hypothetical protein
VPCDLRQVLQNFPGISSILRRTRIGAIRIEVDCDGSDCGSPPRESGLACASATCGVEREIKKWGRFVAPRLCGDGRLVSSLKRIKGIPMLRDANTRHKNASASPFIQRLAFSQASDGWPGRSPRQPGSRPQSPTHCEVGQRPIRRRKSAVSKNCGRRNFFLDPRGKVRLSSFSCVACSLLEHRIGR